MSQLRGWRYLVLVLGLAVIAWMVMDFNGRIAQLNRLNTEHDYVEIQHKEVKGTLTALETEQAYALSDAAVEKWAYEEGHMVRPGDNPVIPLAKSPVTPTPMPRPTVIVTEVSFPESWQALILGPKAP
jgi:hypothetical protein